MRPPRLAQWLLSLFVSADAPQPTLGEFASRSSSSGLAEAQRWYWRQTLHVMIYGIRLAPFLMIALVLAGFWLIGFATRQFSHFTGSYLDTHGIYESHPQAYRFLLTFPLELGRVILCAIVGAIIVLSSRKVGMLAAATLALVQLLLFLSAAILAILGRDWLPWFLTMAPWNLGCVLATFLGAVLIKKWNYSFRPTPN